jgi:hypothetical protein
MARAAVRLMQAGEKNPDLRVPIAHALVEVYELDYPDAELAALVDAILPSELAGLALSAGRQR